MTAISFSQFRLALAYCFFVLVFIALGLTACGGSGSGGGAGDNSVRSFLDITWVRGYAPYREDDTRRTRTDSFNYFQTSSDKIDIAGAVALRDHDAFPCNEGDSYTRLMYTLNWRNELTGQTNVTSIYGNCYQSLFGMPLVLTGHLPQI